MFRLVVLKFYLSMLIIETFVMIPYRIKAVLILGESIMFTVPFKVTNQSLTI